MSSWPFDRDRVIMINVQGASVEGTAATAAPYGERLLVGVVARDFPTPAAGADHIRALQDCGLAVSAGLGDGAADQWKRALQMALAAHPHHLNQIFPAAALSQAALVSAGAATVVNALIRPSGVPGMVQAATGPLSGRHEHQGMPVDVALDMLAEVGVRSVKLFPVEGATRLDELRAVAAATAARDLMLEPTGGITPDNLPAVLDTCLEAGVRWLMPHLYGSVKDADGELSPVRLAAAVTVLDHFAGQTAS